MALQNTPSARIAELHAKQRAFYATGATRPVAWRKDMLRRFDAGLRQWEKPLCDALWEDLHKSYEEAYMTEIGLVYGEIRDALRHVAKWARRRRKPTPPAVLPSASYLIR